MKEDSTELFHAEMEADRNQAADAYFDARPEFSNNDMTTRLCRRMFNEGYERAYRKLWNELRRVEYLGEVAANQVLGRMADDDSRENPRKGPAP